MSDYRDIVKAAIEQGFYLDSCGVEAEEHHYTWGSFIDLCGMPIEEAITPESGDTSGKTKNVITFSMVKNANQEYELQLTASQASDYAATISFTLDEAPYTVVLPAGEKTLNTGIQGTDPAKPYATISGIAIQSDDEKYTYKSNNTVKTGIFTLTIVVSGVTTKESVKYGTEYELPTVEQKEGYDFKWTDAAGTEITGSTYTMPERDTQINGTYTVKSYTLTYEVNEEAFENGSVVTHTTTGSIQVNYGEKVLNRIKNLTPAKVGHTLSGWRFSNGTVINSATTMPASAMTAENTYVLNKYILTYKSEGSVFATEEYYFEQPVTELSNEPTKTGYSFAGWDKTVPATMPANNITLNALFNINKYAIKYYVDGTLKYTEEHTYNTAITIRQPESKVGYTFSGWDTVLPARMPAEDIDVHGTFTINSYVLSCESSGSVIYSKSYEFEETIDASELPTPVEEGYTFTGWNQAVPATMPANNVTLIALFEINQHTVNYNVDGELYSTVTYNYGETIVPIAEPSREGYTFSGWTVIPATMPDYDVTVNGWQIVNQYTLSFLVDGEPYSSVTGNYGTAVPAIVEPSETGYTFSGWTPEVPATYPAENKTFNGYLIPNEHTLTYEVDGEPYSSFTVAYGTEIVPIAEPSREGYTFSGWENVPATMPDNDVTVSGTFTINQYTFTYKVDDVIYTSQTGDYGAQVSAVTDPSKEGYTFSGWTPTVPATFPAENKVFNAIFNINQYTLTYYVDNEEYSALTYDYNAEITPIAEPSREGYTFSGWDSVPERMPANNVRIDGHFVVNQYTLNFFVDDTAYSSVTGDYGTAVPAITEPSEVGHTFSGWTPTVPATFPAQNMRFDGYMVVNSYLATYLIDGNSYSSTTYNYGAEIVYPEVEISGITVQWNVVYQTMPAENIIINGTTSEPNVDIYYDMILTSDEGNVSGVSGMNTYSTPLGEESPALAFIIPGNPEYSYAEENYEEEEFEAWCEAHNYSHYIAVPSGKSFIAKDDAGVDQTNKFHQVGSTFIISGETYQGYAWSTGTCCIATPLTINLKLTIN